MAVSVQIDEVDAVDAAAGIAEKLENLQSDLAGDLILCNISPVTNAGTITGYVIVRVSAVPPA